METRNVKINTIIFSYMDTIVYTIVFILDNYLNYFLIDFIKRINTVVYLSYGRFFNSG